MPNLKYAPVFIHNTIKLKTDLKDKLESMSPGH